MFFAHPQNNNDAFKIKHNTRDAVSTPLVTRYKQYFNIAYIKYCNVAAFYINLFIHIISYTSVCLKVFLVTKTHQYLNFKCQQYDIVMYYICIKIYKKLNISIVHNIIIIYNVCSVTSDGFIEANNGHSLTGTLYNSGRSQIFF